MTAAAADERTPEERFALNREAWATTPVGSIEEVGATMAMIEALNDRIDSLDAELGRLTDAFRALQGARS